MGHGEYDKQQGSVRANMKRETVPATENFTISFHEMGAGLHFIWIGRRRAAWFII